MKNKIKLCFLIAVLMFTVLLNNAKADNYKRVNSFPDRLNLIYWGNLFNYNGPNIPFKWSSDQNTAVYCTLFQKPQTGGPCTLNADDWDAPVKAGVAAIIKKADSSNNGMTTNYYYAEEAINYFLYSYDNNDINRLPNYDKGYDGETIGPYYEVAENAYEDIVYQRKHKSSLAKFVQVWGSGTIDGDVSGDTMKYRITGSGNANSFNVYYKISGTLPNGVTVELKADSTGNHQSVTQANQKITGLSQSSLFYINVTGIDNNPEAYGKSFTINIYSEASYGYDIAENYYCGASVQSYTPNMIKTDKINGKYSMPLKVVVDGSPEYPSLQIIKTDEDTNPLEEASFKIVREDASDEIYETNGEGKVILNEVLEGRYCIKEVAAPEGFMIDDEERCFTLSFDSNNSIVFDSESDAIQYNANSNRITTTYVDSKTLVKIAKKNRNGEYVVGARLKLIKPSDIYKYSNFSEIPAVNGLEWTTDASTKVITGLPEGVYYLVELEAPNGYILNNIGTPVTVKSDQETTVNFVNVKTYVTISKVDITTKEELPGATLRLLDENGEVVKLNGEDLVWVSTTEQKVIEGLAPGTYYLEETQAPDGYAKMTEKIKFTLDEFGKITIDESTDDGSVVIMTNAHTKVYISKQDITTKEELPGATLKLLDEDGNIVRLNGEELIWVSGLEPHYIEGLPAGRTYTLVEETAPDGYSLNTESITFTINEDGTITGDTVMYNTPIPNVPSTLSTKSILVTIGGIAIMSLGIGLYINGFKKKEQI